MVVTSDPTRILLILELLSACALCWGAAVFAEHELSLQHLAVRGSALADLRLCPSLMETIYIYNIYNILYYIYII